MIQYSIEQRDAELQGSRAHIRYHLHFNNASQHLVGVTMELDTKEPEIILALPVWIPGSYKVRDFISDVGNFSVEKNLRFEWIEKHRVRIFTGGAKSLRIHYTYWAHERNVRSSHVNRWHATINPCNMLFSVEGRANEIHHVTINHPWKKVSTALSPVTRETYGALNYDILVDSPLELGNHFTASFKKFGAQHDVAITGTGNFDPLWIVQQLHPIIDQAKKMWGDIPYDRYVFIIQLVPGNYGGLEHARSSVNMYDSDSFADKGKTVKLLALLCHEYFHTWNVKRIRPVELGPFDYNTENYTRMLWLAEGVTSYYDNLMTYRSGFFDEAGYLQCLSDDELGALENVPGRLAMSVKDSSFLSWVKLYLPTADSANRFPSYYLKGGVITLLLDLYIIAHSGGKKRLDDGMRALYSHYKKNPERGITEEEFIAIVSKATAVDIRTPLVQWLNGKRELPVEKNITPFGLKLEEKKNAGKNLFGAGRNYQTFVEEKFTGLSVGETKTGIKVTKVLAASPAEKAGIAVDDEILAMNGIRISSEAQWKTHLGAAQKIIHITASCEGTLYETRLGTTIRSKKSLVKKKNMTANEKKLFSAWLKK